MLIGLLMLTMSAAPALAQGQVERGPDISFCFVIARVRLETGSIWPAIALHAAWNSVIQSAFGAVSMGAGAALWVGEAGILTALALVVAAVIFSRGTWTYVRRLPEGGVPLSQRLAQKPARVT